MQIHYCDSQLWVTRAYAWASLYFISKFRAFLSLWPMSGHLLTLTLFVDFWSILVSFFKKEKFRIRESILKHTVHVIQR